MLNMSIYGVRKKADKPANPSSLTYAQLKHKHKHYTPGR